MATNYWDYVRVEDLLRLQGGLEDDETEVGDHEVVFIVVHQVFELWFKLALREMTTLRNLFNSSPVPENAIAGASASMDRLTRIFRAAVSHFEVVESLNTRDYLDFAALADRLGAPEAAKVVASLDEYYEDQLGPSGSRVATQVAKQLAEPQPGDLSEVDLAAYRRLDRRWQDWGAVAEVCRSVGLRVLDLFTGGAS